MKKPVYIEWIDSQQSPEWADNSDLNNTLKSDGTMRTVGYLVAENDKYLIVSQSHCGNYTQGRLKIPKVCIERLKEIDLGKLLLSLGLFLTVGTMVYMFMNPPDSFIASVADEILQDVEIIIE